MIVVIADDFTGAAEVAAIAMSHGLATEMQTELDTSTDAEVLVIDTDTRSLKPAQAAGKIIQTLESLRAMNPEWIYKKTDSVFRGPVLAELEALLKGTDADRILFIPANPSFHRTIKNGHYFIDDVPLDKTDFANDPEYPAKSADVLSLLGSSHAVKLKSLATPQAIPAQTIAVGDAQATADLMTWAGQLNESVIAAGAADFFTAILESRGLEPEQVKPVELDSIEGSTLFVCTSRSEYSRTARGIAETHNVPVITMPRGLFHAGAQTELLEEWAANTIAALQQTGCTAMAISESTETGPETALRLREYTTLTVERILAGSDVARLYIEGGATASRIAKRLKLIRFIPIQKLAPGVVKMSSPSIKNMHIIVKPGSYPWPDNIWRTNM